MTLNIHNRVTVSSTSFIVARSVVILNVVMLNVVAPQCDLAVSNEAKTVTEIILTIQQLGPIL